ncbi:MAG TPA: TonB-dependent receptor, partial [Opitutaceae bacterium]|nr:TonB-dependent receptor [Opitutaceae bacterium]
ELTNVAKTAVGTSLGLRDDRSTVPLLGLGAAWDVSKTQQWFFNISEGYRPPLFTELVPQGGTTIANEDLQEGRSIQYELGYRSRFASGLVVDVSVFSLEFKNQFGEVALPGGFSTMLNVGRSLHQGAELAVDYDLLAGSPRSQRSLRVFANAMLLEAEFTAGRFAGKTPQHAPDHLVRTGMIYYDGHLKVGLTGTLSGACYGDDGNNRERYIPAYANWDMTVECKVPGTPFNFIAGVNNLFDEDYYTRARNEGLDPSPRRNYYFGGAIEF